MKLNKVYLLFFITYFFLLSPAFAEIRITPNKFEFAVEENSRRNIVNGSFFVHALGTETVRFKIYPEYFEIDKDGTVLTGIENKEKQLTENIRFNPLEFTLQPGQPRRVRFTIPDVKGLTDGEHRIALFLEDVKTKKQALPSPNKNISAFVLIKSRVGVPIYIDKGDVVKSGQIESCLIKNEEDNYIYNISLKSDGNSKIRTKGIAQIIKGNKLVSEIPVKERPVQAGTTGVFEDILPITDLQQGEEYKFKVTFNYRDARGKEQYLVKETSFIYNPAR